MLWDAILGWVHLAAAGLAFGLLMAEYWLLGRPVDRSLLRVLGQAALAAFLALAGVLATGLALAGRLASSRANDPLYWTKLGAFAVVGFAALFATSRVVTWARAARVERGYAPASADLERVRGLVGLKLGLFAVISFIASLLARGYGGG